MTDKGNTPILYNADGTDASPKRRSIRQPGWPFLVILAVALIQPAVYYIINININRKAVIPNTFVVSGGDSGFKMLPFNTITTIQYHDRPVPLDHPTPHILIDGDIITIHYTRRSELLQNGAGAQSWMEGTNPNIIWLPDDADGREIREMMIHELLHFALYKAGGEYHDPLYADRPIGTGGESVINPASRIMLDILRDNPKLVAWLRKRPQ